MQYLLLTIDAKDRITSVSTASVSSDLTIVDDSSTSETITLYETLKFGGGTGILLYLLLQVVQ